MIFFLTLPVFLIGLYLNRPTEVEPKRDSNFCMDDFKKRVKEDSHIKRPVMQQKYEIRKPVDTKILEFRRPKK